MAARLIDRMQRYQDLKLAHGPGRVAGVKQQIAESQMQFLVFRIDVVEALQRGYRIFGFARLFE